MSPFMWGLIVGIIVGGFATAFVINNLHSKKVKDLEDKLANLLKPKS